VQGKGEGALRWEAREIEGTDQKKVAPRMVPESGLVSLDEKAEKEGTTST